MIANLYCLRASVVTVSHPLVATLGRKDRTIAAAPEVKRFIQSSFYRHEWAAKEKAKEEEKAAAAAAAAAAEEAALEEAEMNAPAGVHFGTLPATRTAAGATADPAGAVAGDLSTSAAGLQKVRAFIEVSQHSQQLLFVKFYCLSPAFLQQHFGESTRLRGHSTGEDAFGVRCDAP